MKTINISRANLHARPVADLVAHRCLSGEVREHLAVMSDGRIENGVEIRLFDASETDAWELWSDLWWTFELGCAWYTDTETGYAGCILKAFNGDLS